MKTVPKKLIAICEAIASNPNYAGFECDGLSRLIHYRLIEEGWPSEHFTGKGRWNGITIGHDWVVSRGLSLNYTIDYRLKMWYGSEADVPEGIFSAADFPAVEYLPGNEYNKEETKPLLSVEEYYRLSTRRAPRLLRGIPGIFPPETLTQGRWKYIQDNARRAQLKGTKALLKFEEYLTVILSMWSRTITEMDLMTGNLVPKVQDEINRLHSENCSFAEKTIQNAIRIGELLTAKKADLPHGQFLPWLRTNVGAGKGRGRSGLNLGCVLPIPNDRGGGIAHWFLSLESCHDF
jgi:hypothetical protein